MGELRSLPGGGERIERTMEAEDRCALYVWRCAVYCAAHPEAPPERKKWWNYQDNSPFLREQEENEENER